MPLANANAISVGRLARKLVLPGDRGLAEVVVVGDLRRSLGVHDETVGAPDMRNAVDLAVSGGVLLGRFEHRGDEEVGLELGQVERLVDAEFLLRAGDAVLARLGEIEARACVARSLEIISSLFDVVTSTSMPVSFVNSATTSAGA